MASSWSELVGIAHLGLQELSRKCSNSPISCLLERAVAFSSYKPYDPVIQCLIIMMIIILVTFILGFFTDKYSWTDKIWSIVPVIYCWSVGMGHPAYELRYNRCIVGACIITIWGCRLSFNFWRKGGYKWNGEDYRWPILKEQMHPLAFQVFNLVFIAALQNMLLLFLLSPIYVAWVQCSQKSQHGYVICNQMNWYDIAGIVISCSLLLLEAVADQQQWNFHQRKSSGRLSQEEKRNQFLTSGVWSWSRHPNFFAEQSFWWSLCLFATAATGKFLGWWLAAPALLSLLFQGSTDLTEKITGSKYPRYEFYKRRTSRLIPMPPRFMTMDLGLLSKPLQ